MNHPPKNNQQLNEQPHKKTNFPPQKTQTKKPKTINNHFWPKKQILITSQQQFDPYSLNNLLKLISAK